MSCVCVWDGRAVTLINLRIVIPCLVLCVNAGNSILPIILVGYPTHMSPTPIWEEWLPVHIFNKHHLTTRITSRVGVIGSMNPNALVISNSTLHQLSSSMSSLCFSCPLTQLVLTPDGASLPGAVPAVLGPSLIGHPTCSPAARKMIDKSLPQTQALPPLTFCCRVTAPVVLRSPQMILGMTSLVSLYQTAVHDSWCS